MENKHFLMVLVSCCWVLFSFAQTGNETAFPADVPVTGESLKRQTGTTFNDFNNNEWTVIFTFGQSNSANYGQTPYTCKLEVYSWYNGSMAKAADPLPGASGDKGSVWGRLGDKLIEAGMARKVLIVPVGVGSTTVSQWSEKGELNDRIKASLNDLKSKGIVIDLILWHQGESDNLANTSGTSYIGDFESVLATFRKNNVFAPLFMAIASYHPGSIPDKPNGWDPAVRQAQKEIIKSRVDVYMGPDTDALNKCYYRYDGVHFSEPGLEKHAELWLKSLKRSGVVFYKH
ncbi:MAG: sialate O-acetylesterase [Bacteroidales bacterium]